MRKAIFEFGGFQKMLDESEMRHLEDMMGFRGQWNEHRRFQVEFLKAMGLQSTSTLLEIGCGPLTAGLPVIAHINRGNYTGLDFRENVLNLAYRQIAKTELAAKNPRLICSETLGREELGDATFDFVLAFSVLYHLTDALLDTCFEQVSRHLGPGGMFFANVNTEHPGGTWLQFPFQRRELDFYREAAARSGMEMIDLGQLKDLGFRLGGVERLNNLLQFRLATQEQARS